MLFSASPRSSLMMMVPSIASFSSVRVLRTRVSSLCILSISCLRKMFIGWNGPIFCSLSFTCHGDIQHMSKNVTATNIYVTGTLGLLKRPPANGKLLIFFHRQKTKKKYKRTQLLVDKLMLHPKWERIGSHSLTEEYERMTIITQPSEQQLRSSGNVHVPAGLRLANTHPDMHKQTCTHTQHCWLLQKTRLLF